ncbi:MAG TPA: hypothetical protein PL041_11165 [Melioribacteraceae bacterium]|nr:hypothetical protein [Melioribacteraceae bacterium]
MVLLPQCVSCKHFIKTTDDGRVLCKAFPYGVPKEFLESSGDFRTDNDASIKDNKIRLVHSKIDPRQEGNYIFY